MKHLNYSLVLIFSAFSLLVLNSFKQDKTSCVKGKGTAVTENRTIDGASRISLHSVAKLNISKGKQYSCSISGQQNILDNLIFKLEGDKLVISEKECVTEQLDVTINITVPTLTMVGLAGSGDIHVAGDFNVPAFEAILSGSGNIHIQDALTAGKLNMELSGSGDISLQGSFKQAENRISGSGSITISGTCNTNEISITGTGKIHAFDFSTANTGVNTVGSGNSEVNASNTLNVKIKGSGNVWYKGDPAVTKLISGSGNVSKKG